jgi:uncharacterized DUF497 family protein
MIKRCTGFQWNQGNLAKIWDRHRVSPEECEQTFLNQVFYAMPNGEHTTAEEARFKIFGQTQAGRHLSVIFTIRGDLIRVISARDMNRRERRMYSK